VLADAGYGLSAPFGVRLIGPVAKRGRPRRRHVRDILSMRAEDTLADAKRPTSTFTSAIRKIPGNAVPMRKSMVC